MKAVSEPQGSAPCPKYFTAVAQFIPEGKYSPRGKEDVMHKLPVRHLTAILSDEETHSLRGTLLEPHQIATIVDRSEIGVMPSGEIGRASCRCRGSSSVVG